MRPGVGALRELGGEGDTLRDRARDGFRRFFFSRAGAPFGRSIATTSPAFSPSLISTNSWLFTPATTLARLDALL